MAHAVRTPEARERLAVLLIEDDRVHAEVCLLELSNAGFEVSADVVESPVDVEERIKTNSYDVVLADYRLPGWLGTDALGLLRRYHRDVPFILVTGMLGDEEAVECLKNGVTDVVWKNRLSRLPLVIRRALAETRLRAERERSEKALRANAKKLRRVFESDIAGIVLWRADGSILEANDTFLKMLGYTRQDLEAGRVNWRSMTPPEYEHADDQRMESFRLGKPIGRYEKEHITKDGRRIPVSILSSRLNDSGNVGVAFVTDISSRKQAEEELRNRERQFCAVFDSSLDGIAIVDDQARCLDVNAAGCKLVGCERESLLGKNIGEFCIPSFDFTRAWHEGTNEGSQRGELQLKTSAGNIKQAEYSLAANMMPGRHLIVLHDVTEKRSLERQFQQAQKMEAVGRLAGGVAHDFNNLLMIIGSYAQLIPEQIADRAKVERAAEQIGAAALRAGGVVRQLLAFSRKQVLQPTVLDLNVLVLEVGKMLQRLIGEDVEMRVAAKANGKVKADATQLEQVIMNLAVNARDAMPGGGKLTIETSDAAFDSEHLRLYGIEAAPGEYVLLSVTDTGVGMDADTQVHIFEPFFTTKAVGKGTGLGLATVYGIVQQSGGFISVYSELGKGSTFKIHLPRVEVAEEIRTKSPPPSPVPRGVETILLVEDDEALRAVTRDYLESLGYRVLDAANGERALQIFQARPHSIHLLVTDMVMPGMGGVQLAKTLLQLQPELSVIYGSGYADRSFDLATIGPRAAFLQKPFTLRTLAGKIRELVQPRTGAV